MLLYNTLKESMWAWSLNKYPTVHIHTGHVEWKNKNEYNYYIPKEAQKIHWP